MPVKRGRRGATAVFALGLLLSSIVLAQSGRRLPKAVDKTGGEGDDVKLSTAEVVLPITVRNEYGHLVKGLQESDFVILEDQKRQKMVSFSVQQVPVNVLFLLDASGSVYSEIPAIREAAQKFCDEFTDKDQYSVVQFADKVETLQDWTHDKGLVKHALNWKYRAGESTVYYDSLLQVSNGLLSKVDGRKVIILLTDGVDTGSKTTMETALNAVLKTQATVYIVSKARVQIKEIQAYTGVGGRLTGIAQQAQFYIHQLEESERMMTKLAEVTGGNIFSPIKNDEMTKAYRDVADEIKGQYVVTYVSSNEDQQGFRQIKVALSQAGYTAYTRQGYYSAKAAQ